MKEISIVPVENKDMINKKFDILKKFDHPKIVKIYDIFSLNDNYYIITRFLQKGNLRDFIKNKTLKENQVANIIYQLLMAINYAHSFGVIHSDLKTENILIDDFDSNDKYTIHIIEFG